MEKGDHERAMADMDRLVQLLPDFSGAYFFRAAMGCLTGKDRKSVLADMDRAVKQNPRASFFYSFRGFLKARVRKFIPTCRDAALFVSVSPSEADIVFFRFRQSHQRADPE